MENRCSRFFVESKNSTTFAGTNKQLNVIEDMTAIIGFVALVVIALVGWAIAEMKNKSFEYTNNDEEQAVLDKNREQVAQNSVEELNIKDVIRTIATTGYSAV